MTKAAARRVSAARLQILLATGSKPESELQRAQVYFIVLSGTLYVKPSVLISQGMPANIVIMPI